MPFYKLYAGLGGVYIETIKARNEEDAMHSACTCAIEIYESYEGSQGLRDIDEIMEEDGIDDYDEGRQAHAEEMESWLDYSVKETPNITDKDD